MPNYYAKIEFISAVIRMYIEKRDDSVHNTGIPFLFSISIRWINPKKVEILGLKLDEDDKFTPGMWKAIATELYKYEIRSVIFYRYKHGKKIKRLVRFNKKWLTRHKTDLQ